MTHPGFPVGTPQTRASEYFQRLGEAAKHRSEQLVVDADATLNLAVTDTFQADATTQSLTLTLPNPASSKDNADRLVLITRAPGGTANTVTVSGTAMPNVTIDEGRVAVFVSDGTRWYAS